MMGESRSVLDPEVIRRCEEIGCADIVVGIPSFRNADTIAHVVQAAAAGMVKYFPGLRPVIVNSDGGSTDDTVDVVLQTPVPPEVEKIVTPYKGLPGKGSAFNAIFEIASRLRTRICIVVDSDLRSITPEWIRLLGEPVHTSSYGFVAPYYIRHKYDGTITNNLAYPLTQALYGRRIRQPIGGDFGFTGSLALLYSHMDVWQSDIAKFGIDIWMTTTALTEGFRVCQSAMGVKIHNVKDPGSDLASMFTQVTSTLFYLMGMHDVKWMGVKGSTATRIFGDVRYEEPATMEINVENLMDHFEVGYADYRELWERVLEAANMMEVAFAAQGRKEEDFSFPEKLWAKIVYDYAVAYNFDCDVSRPALVRSMVPLYCARTADTAIRTRNMTSMEAEQLVQRQAEEFEWLKPYLVEKWLKAKAQANEAPQGFLPVSS
ncbi:MAG: glycosyltransferase [Actinomycetota bacterium]|nr:glycosyltransferase [Actinomycetota bacterium]MDD5665949.1 glycosyltransferase [Actinomycetota bacterium]